MTSPVQAKGSDSPDWRVGSRVEGSGRFQYRGQVDSHAAILVVFEGKDRYRLLTKLPEDYLGKMEPQAMASAMLKSEYLGMDLASRKVECFGSIECKGQNRFARMTRLFYVTLFERAGFVVVPRDAWHAVLNDLYRYDDRRDFFFHKGDEEMLKVELSSVGGTPETAESLAYEGFDLPC